MNLPITVGIVDDHPGVRVGIRNLLASAKDIEVVGEGENGAEAIQLAQQKKPDVLLLDVELPILRGDVVMQHLRENKVDVKVLAISSYNDPIYVRGMLENGAAGYITKEEAPGLLVEAVHTIVEDEVKWISPNVARKTLNIMLDNVSLSGTELEILGDVLLGKSDSFISQRMSISPADFKQVINALKEKFHVSSRAELKEAAGCILSTANTLCQH